MVKTYYVLVNDQNKYYDNRYDLWDDAILDAQRFRFLDDALESAELLKCYGQKVNICRVDATLIISKISSQF